MNRMWKMMAAVGAVVCSTAALALDRTSIDSLPVKGNVSVVGVVESLDGDNTMTLRDDTGRVQIKVSRAEYEKLRVGEEVRASGTVKTKGNERRIMARSVINPENSKETDAETKDINAGNSTGEDLYKGSHGPDQE
jgi:hypothetical protein